MRIPTKAGQYRYVKYQDDGVSCYQCLWCLQSINVADDPRHWCFCPKCGSSWFNKLECRNHETPRWVYDRWGNDPPNGLSRCFARRLIPTTEWVFECRTKWFNDPWGDWRLESSGDHERLGDYRWAYSVLNQFRLRHADTDLGLNVKFEYRVILRKKI